jgi:hypothetical protein
MDKGILHYPDGVALYRVLLAESVQKELTLPKSCIQM